MYGKHVVVIFQQVHNLLVIGQRWDWLVAAYPDVPDWWFLIVSVVGIIVIMIVSHVSEMLDWYNVLFALSIPIIFVLPFGMVASITGQLIHNQGIYYVMVGIVGLLWSGDQPKMMTFIAVGYTTYCQTLYIVSNMKLGHYMKIPPRTLFLIQSLTCLVCSSFGVGIQYYFYATQRYFDQKDAFIYQSEFDLTNVDSAMVNNTFWLASRRYKWRHLVHIPLMLATVSWMPLVDAGTLLTWLLICLVGNDMFN
jgi:hypothetical protein